MKIAIPTADGLLCSHFGHCQSFTVLDVDSEKKIIVNSDTHTPPPHEPGVYPKWLGQLGCNLIIAGGMGGRAIDLFRQNDIQVVIGAPNQKPHQIVNLYLNGNLLTGANPCDDPSFHGDKKCDH